MSTIAERVIDLVVFKLHLPEGSVTETSNLAEDFATTSLDMVETIMALEDEFSLEISDRDAERLHTVGDIVALIERKGREARASVSVESATDLQAR